MKSTSKKGSRKSTQKKRSPAIQKPAAASQLTRDNETLRCELAEARSRENATSELLQLIADSPTDLRAVLDTIAERAARLCDATDAQIIRIEGNGIIPVATYGALSPTGGIIPLTRGSPAGRAIVDRQTLHIRDLAAEVETEFPEVAMFQKRLGHRTMLATPMLRKGSSIGAILIRRLEVRPFTASQIKLLETFASQAVIAIENVRLFQELKESLEQQTATSEILGVIASSPTDIQPVLNAVAAECRPAVQRGRCSHPPCRRRDASW